MIAVSAAMMSTSCGPMKFDTRNCTLAKQTPQTMAAGSTPLSPRKPPMTMIR